MSSPITVYILKWFTLNHHHLHYIPLVVTRFINYIKLEEILNGLNTMSRLISVTSFNVKLHHFWPDNFENKGDVLSGVQAIFRNYKIFISINL